MSGFIKAALKIIKKNKYNEDDDYGELVARCCFCHGTKKYKKRKCKYCKGTGITRVLFG